MESRILKLIPDWIFERWIIVAYLVINGGTSVVAKPIEVRPDGKFYKSIKEHIYAYIQDGKMPPDVIAPAILNLADDYLAGRSMTLRAGDYITIQNYLRKGN